jgi:hypothetical protein
MNTLNAELASNILRQFIVVPWEEFQGPERCKLKEIAADVAYACGAGKYFYQAPKNVEAEGRILQSIAISVIDLFENYDHELVRLHSHQWFGLSDDERSGLLKFLGLNTYVHETMLGFAPSVRERRNWASYIAAGYALTTYKKPHVISFEDLAGLIQSYEWDNSQPYKDMLGAGLLIILGTGGGKRGNESRIYGSLRTFLERRTELNRYNIFLDVPEGDVIEAMELGRVLDRKAINKMYQDMFPPDFRMHGMLVGSASYIYPLAVQEAALNERGQATVI